MATGRVERGDREGGRRGGDRRLPRHAQDGGDGRGDVPQAARPGAGGRQHRRVCFAASRRTRSSAVRSWRKPGSVTPHKKFEGEVYVLKKEEGGRHTPFFTNYRPQFYMRTTDVTGTVALPEGTKMVMPGDNIKMTIELITPVASRRAACASRSARAAAPSAPASSPRSSSVRNRKTHGRHHQDSHPPQGVRSPAPRQVGQRHRRDGEAHGRARGRADPAPDAHRALHGPPRPARRQEVARAVRNPHAQAPARHPRADAADARRADEARSVGGRRRRNQDR